MATVGRKAAKRKPRKHRPEILKMKRVARNLGISWGDVCKERDMLREIELAARAEDDAIRQAAWRLHAGPAAEPFWRGGFQRKYRKLLATGGDVAQILGWDDQCDELREICPSVAEWTSADIWDLVVSDYQPLQDVMVHYQNAIARLAVTCLMTSDVAADFESIADAGFDNDTPF